MKTHLLSIFFCLLSYLCFSQSKEDLQFAKLIAVDTITDKNLIAEIQNENDFQNEHFIIKDWVDKNKFLQKALFCKKGNAIIVYVLPNADGDSFDSFDQSDNKGYVTYSTSYSFGSRNHQETKGTYYIIDLRNISVLAITKHLRTEDYDEDTQKNTDSSCSLEISLKDQTLTVIKTSTANKNYQEYFQEDCYLQSGQYKIEEGKLRLISPRVK
jgi:hypothetical protein